MTINIFKNKGCMEGVKDVMYQKSDLIFIQESKILEKSITITLISVKYLTFKFYIFLSLTFTFYVISVFPYSFSYLNAKEDGFSN